MHYNRTGKYLIIAGIIFILLALTFGYSGLLVDFLCYFLFFIGLIILMTGVLFFKGFKRDWMYTIGFMILGIFIDQFNIVLAVICLILSIFFALVINEEGDKHGLIVVGVDIFLVIVFIVLKLWVLEYVSNMTPSVILNLI